MNKYYQLSNSNSRDDIHSILLEWKGTFGVGDFMWGLNVAHQVAHVNNKNVYLGMHWYHDENHLHHFEDPETIIERFDYVRKYYLNQELVTPVHMFNSTDDFISKQRYRGIHFAPTAENRVNYWRFDNRFFCPSTLEKIVVWRPLFNSFIDRGRMWKWEANPQQWETVINILKQDYDVVELTYRTPISEAMYHISNCKLVVCYDGMWHYIARNYFKPMIVFSSNGITRFHTPNAKMVNGKDAIKYIQELNKNWPDIQSRANRYKKQMTELYNAYAH